MANWAKSAPLSSLSMSILAALPLPPHGASSFLRLRICASLWGVMTICEMLVLRLGDIKLVAVGVVKILNVLIGDGDLGGHFTVEQLLDG